MDKIGLIAGGGSLPAEFLKTAKRKGETSVVFAIQDMASADMLSGADKVYWIKVGEYAKLAFLLVKERIRRLGMVGKVRKNVIYEKDMYDLKGGTALKDFKDRKDYTILKGVTEHLKKFGVEVVKCTEYLSHLLPEKGVLGRVQPDERTKEDIEFGFSLAKRLAGMDIGQTLVVKDKTVVAVEAMEGTDATIKRAGEVAGEDCVMIKVSRPDQDLRWDVPTVGPDTMALLTQEKFSAIAIESGKMFLVDKGEFVSLADTAGIVVEVL